MFGLAGQRRSANQRPTGRPDRGAGTDGQAAPLRRRCRTAAGAGSAISRSASAMMRASRSNNFSVLSCSRKRSTIKASANGLGAYSVAACRRSARKRARQAASCCKSSPCTSTSASAWPSRRLAPGRTGGRRRRTGCSRPATAGCAWAHGVAGEDQAGHPGDLAEASACQLAAVQAGQHVGQQAGADIESALVEQAGQVHQFGGQQFEAIVVDADAEGVGPLLRQAPALPAGWPGRRAAASRVSSRESDSGVLTSTVGRRLSCRARSALAVSPLRWPRVQAGARSASGAAQARVVSAASARIGVTHSTPSGGAARPCSGRPRACAGGKAPNATA